MSIRANEDDGGIVRSAYLVSWTYLVGDVSYEGVSLFYRESEGIADECERG
jgi:hypothetical protein